MMEDIIYMLEEITEACSQALDNLEGDSDVPKKFRWTLNSWFNKTWEKASELQAELENEIDDGEETE